MHDISPETGFLTALGDAAAARLGEQHKLAQAARAALDSKTMTRAARVQELLAGLPQADRDALLAEAHRRMRENLAAIWSFLPHAKPSGGMH